MNDITIFADSLNQAAPQICMALKKTVGTYAFVQVFIEPDHQGYFATLKENPAPAAQMTVDELKRAMRMYSSPQPYDVKLEPFPHWMYRGLSDGRKSSKF
jgi:hypothetical protein